MAITPPNRKNTKGAPPPVEKPSDNLTKAPSNAHKLLQFHVSPEMHREFKMYATLHDISMLELFEQCFDFYKKHHQ